MSKEARDLKQMFLQKKPCMILLAIDRFEKPYVSLLMKEADTTFAHTTNILSDMNAYGLVEFVAEGRVKYVKLTKNGKEIVRSLEALNGILDGRNVLKSIVLIDKKLDKLEDDIKAGIDSDRARKNRIKKFDALLEQSKAIEANSAYFYNETLDAAIKRMKERLEYIGTKVPRPEVINDSAQSQSESTGQ